MEALKPRLRDPSSDVAVRAETGRAEKVQCLLVDKLGPIDYYKDVLSPEQVFERACEGCSPPRNRYLARYRCQLIACNQACALYRSACLISD